ncbi:MAG: glycosyltransferase family 4 protein, partial [Candidatus Moranbacteria bacterium]|nr:glycosyltransferase family 4 protein [Candidatus Moranbacteria bacterium]
MRTRVLLVVRWPVGGIRTFLRYVYRNFDAEKWEIAILAPDLPELRILLDELKELKIRYVSIPAEPTPALFFWKILREPFKGKYALVHSHGFTSGICTALPAVMCRTPHLMTSHDVINFNQFVGWKGHIKKWVMGILFNFINTIHSISHDAQENLLENFPFLSSRKNKLIVIPNGIEVERFSNAEPRDLKGELGVGEDVFLIGFLGRFMAQKGFCYLVDAIDLLQKKENLPKRPLVLTFGEGAFIREEKLAIKKRNLEEYFCFMPFAPDVSGTIKGLDVVAMPSLWEACPLQPMEALICGTPFIGTDCIGLREVLNGTPAFVVPKADPHSLANAIEDEF